MRSAERGLRQNRASFAYASFSILRRNLRSDLTLGLVVSTMGLIALFLFVDRTPSLRECRSETKGGSEGQNKTGAHLGSGPLSFGLDRRYFSKTSPSLMLLRSVAEAPPALR
jgi:hypothetical protein